MLQEERRRAIEERVARQLAASHKAHELKIHERLHDRIHGDAAYLLDLRLRDRLAVGDDRKRLERRAGEAVRTVELEKRAHVAPALRRRLQAVRAACAHENESASAALKLLLETAQRLLDLARGAALVNGHHFRVVAFVWRNAPHARTQIADRERRLAREEQRAHDLLKRSRQRNARTLRAHRLRLDSGRAVLLGRLFSALLCRLLALLRRRSQVLFVVTIHLEPQEVGRPASPWMAGRLFHGNGRSGTR